MQPGAQHFCAAPRAGLLRLVRNRVWLCAALDAPRRLLLLALGFLAAGDVAHDLPLFMLRKLRGSGVRADAPDGSKREPLCFLSDDPSVHDATTVRTGLRPSQTDDVAWNRRRFSNAKFGRACPVDMNEKTKGQKETAPASLRFAPSALLDEEDERAALEATQAVAVEVLRRRSGPVAAGACLWRLTVEHRGAAPRRCPQARPLLGGIQTAPSDGGHVSSLGCGEFGAHDTSIV